MCEPTTLAVASFALGAAQSIATYAAGQQEASNQRAYQAAVTRNAEIARANTMNQITMRQNQEIDRASQELFDNQTRAVQARARSEVSAGEAGVLGNSIEAIARDFYMQQGRIDTATVRNNTMAVQQLQAEKDQANAQFDQRTTFQSIREPSILGLGLGIGAAGVDAYTRYDRLRRGGAADQTPIRPT